MAARRGGVQGGLLGPDRLAVPVADVGLGVNKQFDRGNVVVLGRWESY